MTDMTEVPGPLPQTALVTGAAKRIGRAIALDLAKAGFAIAVHHKDSEREARDLVSEIEASGGRAVALAADFMKEADTAPLMARAARPFRSMLQLRGIVQRG